MLDQVLARVIFRLGNHMELVQDAPVKWLFKWNGYGKQAIQIAVCRFFDAGISLIVNGGSKYWLVPIYLSKVALGCELSCYRDNVAQEK